MLRGLMILAMMAVILFVSTVQAQMVRYSPYFREFSIPFFQVAGKAGEYYWVEKEKAVSSKSRGAGGIGFQQIFEVYDGKMNAVQKIRVPQPRDGAIKQFLVGGRAHFDQLLILQSKGQTRLLLKRFSPDGATEFPDRIIDSLPINENGKSFLLLRSPNGSRLQLLAFESRPESAPLLHTILFDDNWNVIFNKVIDNKNISQPCIQDDFVSFALEDFDNMPAKLADNGEWLISAPSRTSNGYLFFHGCDDGTFSFREIRLSSSFSMEDISLTLDRNNTGASVGILSSYKNSALRKLQVVHYSMDEGRFNYDSGYLFNTLAGDMNFKTIVRETLSGLPQGGYIFCKEYSAGDLSVFYFPTSATDSAWTTTIHEPQKPEANWPSLSYLMLPTEEKLLFVYNMSTGYSDYPATATVDRKGNATSDGVAFWRFNRVLNFQHGRRISGEEVAVPYQDAPGFAIIRL